MSETDALDALSYAARPAFFIEEMHFLPVLPEVAQAAACDEGQDTAEADQARVLQVLRDLTAHIQTQQADWPAVAVALCEAATDTALPASIEMLLRTVLRSPSALLSVLHPRNFTIGHFLTSWRLLRALAREQTLEIKHIGFSMRHDLPRRVVFAEGVQQEIAETDWSKTLAFIPVDKQAVWVSCRCRERTWLMAVILENLWREHGELQVLLHAPQAALVCVEDSLVGTSLGHWQHVLPYQLKAHCQLQMARTIWTLMPKCSRLVAAITAYDAQLQALQQAGGPQIRRVVVEMPLLVHVIIAAKHCENAWFMSSQDRETLHALTVWLHGRFVQIANHLLQEFYHGAHSEFSDMYSNQIQRIEKQLSFLFSQVSGE